MRASSFLLFFLLLATISRSQTVISGKVLNARGEPLAGVSLSIESSYDGTTSDSAGSFRFVTSEKAPLVLVVTAINFKTLRQVIDQSTDNQSLSLVLKENINEMQAVVITAGSFEASDKKKGTVLSSIDMLTTASANADVTGAVKTLPGTQQVGESEGLFVRGGTASETRTYIDGTLVNNFFYSSVPNIAQRGRFSPWILKGTVFSAGGYSALYGQALSSALILETVEMPERSSGNLSLSFIGGSLGIQKLSKNEKFSWGLSYGYTNLSLAFKVLKRQPEYFTIPQYHTADANFRIRTSSTGIIKYYGYFSENKVGVRNPSLDSLGYKDAFRLKNFNHYHNLSWRENFGSGWKINAGVSYSNNQDNIHGSLQDGHNVQAELSGLEFKNFSLDSKSDYVNVKTVIEKRFVGLNALRFGSELNYSNEYAEYFSNSAAYPSHLKESSFAAFAETDLYLTNNLAAKLGSRVEHSSLLGKYNFAPRASLAYKLSKATQLSMAYGIFYQSPERRYLPALASLGFMKATHYILQLQKATSLQTLRAEVFYKKYDDLVKTTTVNNIPRAISNDGNGYAQGFELFYRDKKTIKNFDYWISYSYLDTKRNYLNYPSSLQPSFAAKHTANLVVKKFVTGLKTQFNANYTFASGRPYYNIRYDDFSDKFNIYDQGKTISYNSLSLSVNYLPNVFKKGAGQYTVFVFSVTNVLGSKQIFGYNYSYNGLRKEAIVPPTKTFVYLGAFISFGVDRSQDVINSTL